MQQAYIESVNSTLHYQQGRVTLPGGRATITMPRGFRYLDSAQSRRVLTELWGNPDGSSLGMLFPIDRGPLDAGNWAYTISYDDIGYVSDDDADDINYGYLLTEMQEDTDAANPDRIAKGFPRVTLLGWAANPFYDKNKHALHWAQSLLFDHDSTLNYNLRVLGRKGVLVLNAIASPNQIGEVRSSIPALLSSVDFERGQRYADFDPDLDEVAAYTIGGLVAGKVLAKVGFFALLLKFWKVGLIALAGAWAAMKRFFGFGNSGR
jgi:uncharacterized membrane-anchored protein